MSRLYHNIIHQKNSTPPPRNRRNYIFIILKIIYYIAMNSYLIGGCRPTVVQQWAIHSVQQSLLIPSSSSSRLSPSSSSSFLYASSGGVSLKTEDGGVYFSISNKDNKCCPSLEKRVTAALPLSTSSTTATTTSLPSHSTSSLIRFHLPLRPPSLSSEPLVGGGVSLVVSKKYPSAPFPSSVKEKRVEEEKEEEDGLPACGDGGVSADGAGAASSTSACPHRRPPFLRHALPASQATLSPLPPPLGRIRVDISFAQAYACLPTAVEREEMWRKYYIEQWRLGEDLFPISSPSSSLTHIAKQVDRIRAVDGDVPRISSDMWKSREAAEEEMRNRWKKKEVKGVRDVNEDGGHEQDLVTLPSDNSSVSILSGKKGRIREEEGALEKRKENEEGQEEEEEDPLAFFALLEGSTTDGSSSSSKASKSTVRNPLEETPCPAPSPSQFPYHHHHRQILPHRKDSFPPFIPPPLFYWETTLCGELHYAFCVLPDTLLSSTPFPLEDENTDILGDAVGPRSPAPPRGGDSSGGLHVLPSSASAPSCCCAAHCGALHRCARHRGGDPHPCGAYSQISTVTGKQDERDVVEEEEDELKKGEKEEIMARHTCPAVLSPSLLSYYPKSRPLYVLPPMNFPRGEMNDGVWHPVRESHPPAHEVPNKVKTCEGGDEERGGGGSGGDRGDHSASSPPSPCLPGSIDMKCVVSCPPSIWIPLSFLFHLPLLQKWRNFDPWKRGGESAYGMRKGGERGRGDGGSEDQEKQEEETKLLQTNEEDDDESRRGGSGTSPLAPTKWVKPLADSLWPSSTSSSMESALSSTSSSSFSSSTFPHASIPLCAFPLFFYWWRASRAVYWRRPYHSPILLPSSSASSSFLSCPRSPSFQCIYVMGCGEFINANETILGPLVDSSFCVQYKVPLTETGAVFTEAIRVVSAIMGDVQDTLSPPRRCLSPQGGGGGGATTALLRRLYKRRNILRYSRRHGGNGMRRSVSSPFLSLQERRNSKRGISTRKGRTGKQKGGEEEMDEEEKRMSARVEVRKMSQYFSSCTTLSTSSGVESAAIKDANHPTTIPNDTSSENTESRLHHTKMNTKDNPISPAGEKEKKKTKKKSNKLMCHPSKTDAKGKVEVEKEGKNEMEKENDEEKQGHSSPTCWTTPTPPASSTRSMGVGSTPNNNIITNAAPSPSLSHHDDIQKESMNKAETSTATTKNNNTTMSGMGKDSRKEEGNMWWNKMIECRQVEEELQKKIEEKAAAHLASPTIWPPLSPASSSSIPTSSSSLSSSFVSCSPNEDPTSLSLYRCSTLQGGYSSSATTSLPRQPRQCFTSPYWIAVDTLQQRWGVSVSPHPSVTFITVNGKRYVNAENTTDASIFCAKNCHPGLLHQLLGFYGVRTCSFEFSQALQDVLQRHCSRPSSSSFIVEEASKPARFSSPSTRKDSDPVIEKKGMKKEENQHTSPNRSDDPLPHSSVLPSTPTSFPHRCISAPPLPPPHAHHLWVSLRLILTLGWTLVEGALLVHMEAGNTGGGEGRTMARNRGACLPPRIRKLSTFEKRKGIESYLFLSNRPTSRSSATSTHPFTTTRRTFDRSRLTLPPPPSTSPSSFSSDSAREESKGGRRGKDETENGGALQEGGLLQMGGIAPKNEDGGRTEDFWHSANTTDNRSHREEEGIGGRSWCERGESGNVAVKDEGKKDVWGKMHWKWDEANSASTSRRNDEAYPNACTKNGSWKKQKYYSKRYDGKANEKVGGVGGVNWFPSRKSKYKSNTNCRSSSSSFSSLPSDQDVSERIASSYSSSISSFFFTGRCLTNPEEFHRFVSSVDTLPDTLVNVAHVVEYEEVMWLLTYSPTIMLRSPFARAHKGEVRMPSPSPIPVNQKRNYFFSSGRNNHTSQRTSMDHRVPTYGAHTIPSPHSVLGRECGDSGAGMEERERNGPAGAIAASSPHFRRIEQEKAEMASSYMGKSQRLHTFLFPSSRVLLGIFALLHRYHDTPRSQRSSSAFRSIPSRCSPCSSSLWLSTFFLEDEPTIAVKPVTEEKMKEEEENEVEEVPSRASVGKPMTTTSTIVATTERRRTTSRIPNTIPGTSDLLPTSVVVSMRPSVAEQGLFLSSSGSRVGGKEIRVNLFHCDQLKIPNEIQERLCAKMAL